MITRFTKVDRKLWATSLATIVVRIAGAFLGLAVAICLGRLLGPSSLGIYALIMTVVVLLAVPMGSGWQRLLMRSASWAYRTADWGESVGIERRGQQLAIVLGIGVLAVVLALRAMGIAFNGLSFGIVVSAALVLVFDQLSALRTAVLRSCDGSARGTLPEMVVRPLGQLAAIGGMMLAHIHIGVEQALYSLVAGSFLAFLVGAGLLRSIRPAVGRQAKAAYRTRDWAISSSILGANALMNILNSQASLLLLGYLASTRDAGLYRVAVQVSLFAALGYTALNMIAGQRFAYLGGPDDVQERSDAGHFFARLAFLFTLPFLVILMLFGRPLFSLAFGSPFEPAARVAVVLILGQVINCAIGMAGSLLVMQGLEKLLVRATLVGLATNLAVAVILIPLVGPMGAAIASAASMTILNLLTWLIVWRGIGIDTSILGLAPRPRPESS